MPDLLLVCTCAQVGVGKMCDVCAVSRCESPVCNTSGENARVWLPLCAFGVERVGLHLFGGSHDGLHSWNSCVRPWEGSCIVPACVCTKRVA
mmetsp:Transcript_22090/g.39153  ORF Transcript_22090/g.39153 Transcript_22090/m.39153 type:complete len:92 (+) Transcript_22090:329-604(+)